MKFMSSIFAAAVLLCYFGYSQSFYIRPHKSHPLLHQVRDIKLPTYGARISKVLPKVVHRELILLSLWTKAGYNKATAEDFSRAHFLLSHHAPMEQVVGLFVDDPAEREPIVARMRVAARVLLRKALLAQRLKMLQSYKAANAHPEEEEDITSASGSGDVEKQIDNTVNTPVDDEDHLNTETDVVISEEDPIKVEDQSGEGVSVSAQGSGSNDDEEEEKEELIKLINSDLATGPTDAESAGDRSVENSGFFYDAEDDDVDDDGVVASGDDSVEGRSGSVSDTSSLWLDDEDFAGHSGSANGGSGSSGKLENSGDALGLGSGSIAEEYSGQDLYEIITVHRIEKPVITPAPDKTSWSFGDSDSQATEAPVESYQEEQFDTALDSEDVPRIVEPTVIKPSEVLDLGEEYSQPEAEEDQVDADFDLSVIPDVRPVYPQEQWTKRKEGAEDYVSDIF